MHSIGDYIRKLRKLKNLSQEDLAIHLRISRATCVQIEQRKRDLTLHEANKLAELFGINFDDFCSHKLPEESTVVIKKTKQNRVKKVHNLRISVPQKHIDKFKEVLLYILEKVGSKPNIGQTVIYKLLYFIDFDFYEKYEEQLIGATYIKNHYGPTPIEFKTVVDDMKKAEEIIEIKSKYFKYPQTKYMPIRKANLSGLTAIEKEHIDDVLMRLSDKTAAQLSAYSHQDVPWITTEDGTAIDYESVFYRTDYTSVRTYDETQTKSRIRKFSTLQEDLAVAQKSAVEFRHMHGIDNQAIVEIPGKQKY